MNKNELIISICFWSHDATTNEFKFKESFKVTDKCYELAFTYLVSEPLIKRVGSSEKFIVTNKSLSSYINNDLLKDNYSKLK